MNEILPLYSNKRKTIAKIIAIVMIMVFIHIAFGKNTNDNIELSTEEKMYIERVEQRDQNDNAETIESIKGISTVNLNNIEVSSDNTVNIVDFGAVGDANYYNESSNKYYSDKSYTTEAHSNSDAIQSCLDYAQENGYNVKIPKGTYLIEKRILLPDNIELIGEDGATFLVYDNFYNTDDFVFRNKHADNNGIIKIKNLNFKLETYKEFEFKEKELLYIKIYDLKELSIDNCKVENENKGIPNLCTEIDIRGNFEKIDITNNTLINESKSTVGGNLWIRNNYLDGEIGEINITDNTIIKNGNDEAIATWGKSKMGKINVKRNHIEYTNSSDMTNDIFITCMSTENTFKLEEYCFEENDIKVNGSMQGLIIVMNNNGEMPSINIKKNVIAFNSTFEDAYGGVLRFANYNIDKMYEQDINICENQIDSSEAVGCRQIFYLRNSKVNVYNNNINAKVTYGVTFVDNNSEKVEMELNDNIINANLLQGSSIFSSKDVNVNFIANNNTINNLATNYRNIVFLAKESDNYDYQKKAKQTIILKNNKFTNLYRILQNSDKNDIDNFVVERNEFDGLTEIMYESGLKNIFNGRISIKDNYFYNKNEERVMNILKTDLSNVDEIQTQTNYFINKNIEEVKNSILEKCEQLKTSHSEDIEENNLTEDINKIKEYISSINEENLNEEKLVETIIDNYELGNKIIENNRNNKKYDNIDKIIELLNKIEEISTDYTDLLIALPQSQSNNIMTNNIEEIEKLLNENSDIPMNYASEKLENVKSCENKIENIQTFNDSNTKIRLLQAKELYVEKVCYWIKEVVNLYIDKYIEENPITVSYSIPEDQFTNGDVKVTVNIGNDTKITNNDGNNELVFTTNGNYEFFYNRRQRNGTITAIVNNIDKDKPKIIDVKQYMVYNNAIAPVAVDTNLENVELYSYEEKNENYINGSKIAEEGIYKLVATDKAQNKTEVDFQIIEKTNSKYDVVNQYIKNIEEKTTLKEFKNKLPIKLDYEVKRNNKTLNESDKVATGDILEVKNSGQKYTLIVAGDINKDGEVKSKDLTMLRSYILGKTKLDNLEKLAADANVDGKEIGAKDLVKVRILILNQK